MNQSTDGLDHKLTALVMADICRERIRQEDLRIAGKFEMTCATEGMNDDECLAVLAEEFGEVSREIVEACIARHKLAKTNDLTWEQQIKASRIRARKELVQVAAVCVAWLERLDRELEK